MKSPKIKLHIKNLDPISVECSEDNSSVVSLLLTALHLNKDSSLENEIMFLKLSEKEDKSIFFKRSDLISIETTPSPTEEVFATVQENIVSIERELASQRLDDGWKQWIWTHLAEGFDKDTIYQALLNHGISANVVAQELNHTLNVSNINAEQVARLTGAKKSEIYIPNGVRLNSNQSEIFTIDDFLSEEECVQILKLIKGNLEPSRVFAKEQINEARTSRTCFFKDKDKTQVFIRFIEDRVSKIMGIHPSYMEGAQAQYYGKGQEYQPHADYFSKGTDEYEENLKEGMPGQRTWTFMVYLNDDFEGGQTYFPQTNIEIKPKRGMALLWNNLYPDGQPNPYTHHQSKPVEEGRKAILNFWFRERGQNEQIWVKPDAEYIANYTKHGIALSEIPDHIYNKVIEYYQENRNNKSRIATENPTSHLNKGDDKTPASEVISLTDDIRSFLHEQLKPICEKWSGQALEPTAIYGIRRYFEGARLEPHYDWCDTHIISAILCLDLSDGQNWPLQIDDNYYRRHQVVMKPKDLLLYEGSRLLHGRPEPLKSGFHCNLYVHYRPKNHVVPEKLKNRQR